MNSLPPPGNDNNQLNNPNTINTNTNGNNRNTNLNANIGVQANNHVAPPQAHVAGIANAAQLVFANMNAQHPHVNAGAGLDGRISPNPNAQIDDDADESDGSDVDEGSEGSAASNNNVEEEVGGDLPEAQARTVLTEALARWTPRGRTDLTHVLEQNVDDPHTLNQFIRLFRDLDTHRNDPHQDQGDLKNVVYRIISGLREDGPYGFAEYFYQSLQPDYDHEPELYKFLLRSLVNLIDEEILLRNPSQISQEEAFNNAMKLLLLDLIPEELDDTQYLLVFNTLLEKIALDKKEFVPDLRNTELCKNEDEIDDVISDLEEEFVTYASASDGFVRFLESVPDYQKERMRLDPRQDEDVQNNPIPELENLRGKYAQALFDKFCYFGKEAIEKREQEVEADKNYFSHIKNAAFFNEDIDRIMEANQKELDKMRGVTTATSVSNSNNNANYVDRVGDEAVRYVREEQLRIQQEQNSRQVGEKGKSDDVVDQVDVKRQKKDE